MDGKLIFSIIMIIFILILVYFLSKRYRLSKKQMIIFWILVLFWSSVSIIRAYRKIYAVSDINVGGLGLEAILAVQITAAYGLISFILRLPLFLLSDALNKKKIFIQLGMVFMIIASILVYIKPSYNTLYISSLSMGVCASMVAIFNVIFSETFTNENAAVSTSILSLAPLLAEFIAAPIQYLGTYGEYKNYGILWLSSAIIAIITLILTIYVPSLASERTKKLSLKKISDVTSNKLFIYICIIAFFQSVIKFSTSGANMIVYGKNIGMSSIMLAYNDAIFAAPQLIASIIVGIYLIRKMKLERILQIGIIFSVLFFIITIITNNPLIVFLSYTLNGFGYGLVYTSLISISLEYFSVEYRNISMGIFQAFFSAGIYFGDSIYKFIITQLPNGLLGVSQDKTVFLIASIISAFTIFLCSLNIYFRTKSIKIDR